jgi:KDEL-tailed cysteine endopeptidase
MDTGKVILVVFSVVLVFRLARSFDYSEEDLASEERLWDLYEKDGGVSTHSFMHAASLKNKSASMYSRKF